MKIAHDDIIVADIVDACGVGKTPDSLEKRKKIYLMTMYSALDEATLALDSETEIMESITNLLGQKTMIIIAYRLTTIENDDHIYRVGDGKILKER